MNLFQLLAAGMCCITLSNCQDIAEKEYELRAEIVDDEGSHVPGATVVGARQELRKDTKIALSKNVKVSADSNDDGIALLQFKSLPTPGGVAIHKQGYYSSFYSVNWKPTENVDSDKRAAGLKAILKPMKNPVPMHASFFGNTRIMIPSLNVDYGYDLQRCSLTAPHGSGREKDVIFRVEGTNDGNGNGRMKLTIRTNAKKAGFFPFSTPDRDRGSDLISGYLAPEKQYASVMSLLFDSSDVEAKMNQPTDGNLYFRVRTKLKSDSSIESCHYGKIYGPFTFWGIPTSRGGVATFGMATCYFNPTPNDRNVEFDTKRNLNPDGNVWSP